MTSSVLQNTMNGHSGPLPYQRQGNEQAGEEAGDDVENHERGQARHCEMLHCVEAEEADSDEEKSTVDLTMSSNVTMEAGEEKRDDDLFKS